MAMYINSPKTYVVLIRNKVIDAKKAIDFVNIFTEEEARQHNWIDEKGNRVWVLPAKDEFSNTFVWEFDDPDKAVDFYDMLTNSAVGIETVAR